jgi:integrase
MSYGQGTREPQKDGRVRVRIPDGKGGRIEVGTFGEVGDPNKTNDALAARHQAAALEARNRMGDVIAESFASYGLRVIDTWESAGKRSHRSDRSRWTRYVLNAEWAQRPCELATRGEIRDWLRSLLKTESDRGSILAESSIKHLLVLVRRVFTEAVEHELRLNNPAVGIQPPTRNEAPKDNWDALDEAEIEHVLTHPVLKFQQRVAVALAIYTGLREGELAALHWSDVHLDGPAPHLVVRRSWEKDRAPKNGRLHRVELLPAAVDWFRRWERTRVNDLVWGKLYAEGYDWGWGDTPTKRVTWLGIRRKCGITRRITWHHLRDTFATHLLSGSWGRSWEIAEVAAQLGHGTTYVTERYARVLNGRLAIAAAATKGGSLARAEPAERGDRKASNRPSIAREWQAVRDSNARPLAPEANALSS